MGLFNDIVGGIFGSGGGNTQEGFDKGVEYLEPWRNAGQNSLANQEGYLGGMRKNLDKFGNPAEWSWSQINQSPQEFYQNLMSGYEQSPQYQQQMYDMEKAMINAAAASGMTGSGAFYDNWQRNAQNITAQDQDRWLNSMLGVNNQQMNYLGDYRNQQNTYLNNLSGLSQMGLNAANQSGQFAAGAGQAQDANNPWGNIANMGAAMYLGGRK
ncbi:hypothetical protein UFOVP1361_63 [uncultured Caudovirales phage]|uniref:Uncharacterized protein n=1 Tax=uncultured Caudovirales phage TaxID=2100421 RepID=A0A6J5S2X9_9CAUD|nr:hypothetical protein UFOVP1361_63 [uncultured Caudovirales phage]